MDAVVFHTSECVIKQGSSTMTLVDHPPAKVPQTTICAVHVGVLLYVLLGSIRHMLGLSPSGVEDVKASDYAQFEVQ